MGLQRDSNLLNKKKNKQRVSSQNWWPLPCSEHKNVPFSAYSSTASRKARGFEEGSTFRIQRDMFLATPHVTQHTWPTQQMEPGAWLLHSTHTTNETLEATPGIEHTNINFHTNTHLRWPRDTPGEHLPKFFCRSGPCSILSFFETKTLTSSSRSRDFPYKKKKQIVI